MDQRWVHPFLCGREILNCNWIMREFYFGKFLVIKSTGECRLLSRILSNEAYMAIIIHPRFHIKTRTCIHHHDTEVMLKAPSSR